jgi:hypothetical protein
MRLALHFDMASEISAPPNPKTAANTSNPKALPPWAAMYWSIPSTFMATDRTNTTARFVARNSRMRFMGCENS